MDQKGRRLPLSEWKRLLSTETRVIYGIDMSLTNPGLCVMNPSRKTIRLYCYRNRKKERSMTASVSDPRSVFADWIISVCLIEPPPCSSASDDLFGRYLSELQVLLALIGPNTSGSSLLAIEGYSFNTTPTPGDTKLKELGGCLRLFLRTLGYAPLELPPAAVKLTFAERGSARKTEMYRAYRERFQLPDLFGPMGLSSSDSYKETPHPIEDLVDALAVAMTALASSQDK